MGKKRQLGADGDASWRDAGQKSQYVCYYCNTECRDEESLVRHQQSKHFRCPHCDPGSPFRFCQSVAGLVAHVRRSHKMELTKVPGAIEGREDVKVDVFGMSGIPEAALPKEAPSPPPTHMLGAGLPPPPQEPTDAGVEGVLAVLEMHKQAEAKRRREAAEAVHTSAILAAAASGPPPPTLATAALGAIGSLSSLGGEGAAPVPQLPPAPAAWVAGQQMALPPTAPVWGRWRHSRGGEVTVTPGANGSVIVSHAVLGELTVGAADLQGVKVRFCQREGTREGNVINWNNGASWVKVL